MQNKNIRRSDTKYIICGILKLLCNSLFFYKNVPSRFDGELVKVLFCLDALFTTSIYFGIISILAIYFELKKTNRHLYYFVQYINVFLLKTSIVFYEYFAMHIGTNKIF